jgi:putative DNA modification/repair radical SAM protein
LLGPAANGIDSRRRSEHKKNTMRPLSVADKLEILADAAKYDASCASSGDDMRDSRRSGGIGSSTGKGICHSYTPDGRCVSLLKILLTNACIFDCSYCINRRTSNVRRARFSVQEAVDLTLEFYKRNYIEGLFLSSGIIRSPDYTMECLVRVARTLRTEHAFRGYIHLKTIPEASSDIVREAGLYADRLSINIEMPTPESLQRFAPEKRTDSIHGTMRDLGGRIADARADRRAPRFAPAGQSTQLIVGADSSSDSMVLATASDLYNKYNLRRIYYSAFSPIPQASALLPARPAPLLRENRLYQADWLLRYYGFTTTEIMAGTVNGMLEPDTDPKLAWALRNRDRFPVDVNTADRDVLLRIPGLGVRSADRLLSARRFCRLRLDDLRRLTNSFRKMLPFVIAVDHHPGSLLDHPGLRRLLAPRAQQLALFG